MGGGSAVEDDAIVTLGLNEAIELWSDGLEENQIPNWFGSNLRFHVNDEPAIRINGVDSATASKIYSFAQEQEHAWEERRRVRSLEETRAAS